MRERSCARAGSRPSFPLLLHTLWLALCLIFPIAPVLGAGADHKSDKKERRGDEAVEIDNFGQLNDHYYRGAQPKDQDYPRLAALGVKTVVDLREDAKGGARALAERAGLRYVNLRMNARRPPSIDEAQGFLALVNDPANWPVFVHCAGGRHRTGVMTAIYRMAVDGWDAERAYQEMKQYKFYASWGHGDMRDYVFAYYRELQQRRAQQSASAPIVQAAGAARSN